MCLQSYPVTAGSSEIHRCLQKRLRDQPGLVWLAQTGTRILQNTFYNTSLIIIETVHIVDIVCNLDVVDIVDICEPVDIVDFMAG